MRNDDTQAPLFESSDLNLTVSLLLSGFELYSLDVSNPSRVIFKFISSEDLHKAVSSFWEGKLSFEPKEFSNAQRELKARIRSAIYEQS